MSPQLAKRNSARFPNTLKKANKRVRKHWAPPATLSMLALAQLENEPRVLLSRAIDLMAFGGTRTRMNSNELAYQRITASRALCGAARTKALTLYGNPDVAGDKSEKIPRRYFDMPRCLGEIENTLFTDLDAIAIDHNQKVTLERFPFDGGHALYPACRK